MDAAPVAFPKPGEAWVDGCCDEGARSAFAAGARIVRTAVPAGDAGAGAACAGLGYAPGPQWIVGRLDDPTRMPADAPPPAASGRSPVLRARRLSGGQWHNPRVRLAVQFAVERAVPREVREAAGPGRGPWGLIATPGGLLPLASFGPFDLQDAIARGEVVTAGDPAQPAGVMLLVEVRRERKLLLRWLSGSPPAAASLLAYVAERAAHLNGAALEISLPADAPLPADGWPGGTVHLRRLRVYERPAPPS